MQQHPYPPHSYAPPKPATGALGWILGLTSLVLLLPFFNNLIGGVTMAIVAKLTGKGSPLSLENSRRAANWGLTCALLSVLLAIPFFILIFGYTEQIEGHFFPTGLFVIGWAALSLLHLVVSVAGFVVAQRGKVVKWNGIPFFRAPKHPATL